MLKQPESNLVTSNFNPINALDWNESTGFGNLPGSNLKFKLNEFGTLELVNNSKCDTSQRKSLVKLQVNQMNQQQQQQEKVVTLNDRFKQCPTCAVIKYKSTFYHKGKLVFVCVCTVYNV